MWGIISPSKSPSGEQHVLPCARTPKSNSPVPQGQPGHSRTRRNPCPSRAPALGFQQLWTAPAAPGLCYRRQPELPRLEDTEQTNAAQVSALVLTVSLPITERRRNQQRQLSRGRRRGGSQGSCAAGFPGEERAGRWASSPVVRRTRAVPLNTDTPTGDSTHLWLWVPGGSPAA